MDCNQPGSFVHGIFQARILAWVAISSSRASSWPTDWTYVSCIASRFFSIWATREAPLTLNTNEIKHLKWRSISNHQKFCQKSVYCPPESFVLYNQTEHKKNTGKWEWNTQSTEFSLPVDASSWGGKCHTLIYACMLTHSVVSYSLGLFGPEPTKLLCPWDFSGKNTGVGWYFLLQMILCYLFLS